MRIKEKNRPCAAIATRSSERQAAHAQSRKNEITKLGEDAGVAETLKRGASPDQAILRIIIFPGLVAR